MSKLKWIACGFIVLFIVISCFAYQKITDDTYMGMSIIPEQRTDLPLYKGLKPTEDEYVVEGNQLINLFI